MRLLLALAPFITHVLRAEASAVAADVEHVVTLNRRSGVKLGFSFNTKARIPTITHIAPVGLMASWNQLHPGDEVRIGDEIIEVNGIRGSVPVFLAAFRTSTRLQIRLWRRAYSVSLDKSDGAELGISLGTELKTALTITGIAPGGLVAEWNLRQPEAQVQLGDEILEVNDVRGSANLLYQECARHRMLRMTLWRRRLLDAAPEGQQYFWEDASKIFEQTYWPRFSGLFLEEGVPNYPMPPRNKVPDLLHSLRDVKGLAVHTEPGTTVTEGQGYAMFAAGMHKDVETLMGLTVAWQAAGQGFADRPACGGCGAKCSGSLYGSCLCKTIPGAYMPGWAMPMDKDYKMGSATDGDQDAITGLIYLAELTDSVEFRKYAVHSIAAFVLEDLGYGNVTENSRKVPVVGDIPEKHQTMYLWRTGTCGGGFDRTSHDANHDLCLSPGYFAPGQWRLFQRYVEKHAELVPAPYSAAGLSQVLESAIVWGYNMLQRIACPNGLVSNWWSLPKTGWPHQGKLQCTNSGTEAGAYYSDAARIPWRVVLDYLWFPDASTPIYNEQGRLDGTWGAKEYANRWAGAWIKLIQSESAGATGRLTGDVILGLLSKLDGCQTVPEGFTALPKNGWGALPLVTTFQVPMHGVTPHKGLEWLSYVANISFRECVNTQYFDLGQEVIVSSMVGGHAWLPMSKTEFLITLDKGDGQQLGIDLDQRGPVLFIKAVLAGLVQSWNERNPFWAVRAGDEILAVNDIAGNASKQIGEIRTKQHLMIKLLRTGQSFTSRPPRPSVVAAAESAIAASLADAKRTTTTTTTTSTEPESEQGEFHSSTRDPQSGLLGLGNEAVDGSSSSSQVHGSTGKCAGVNKQCGGKLWKGTTCCESGCHCKKGGPYYSQCVPPAGKTFCNETATKMKNKAKKVVMDDVSVPPDHLTSSNSAWSLLGWPSKLLAGAGFLGLASASMSCRRHHRVIRLRSHGYSPTLPMSPSHGTLRVV